MPWSRISLAIARFLTPGYALARAWRVSFPLSLGFGSQSGLSFVGSPSQSQTVPGWLQSIGLASGKMHAYSMSPAGCGMFHSRPFIGFRVVELGGVMAMPVMGSVPERGMVDSCMKGEIGGT